MEDHDYSKYQTSDIVGDNLMARLEGLAQEQLDAEKLVETMELRLKEAKAVLKFVSEKKLPELVDEAQLGESKIVTPNGIEIKVGEVIRGNIKKENEEEAFAWLEENGDGALIKRTFIIEFNKSEEAWAAKFQRDCAQRKRKLTLKRTKGVHTGTLKSFVGKALNDGVKIPMDLLGVFRQRVAKVKVKG